MIKLLNILKEIESEKKYTIYCDMDGVLSDFDKQLEIYTGIKNGRSWEKKHGTPAFWDEIDVGGLKFWSEMPWMSDGKKLWSYLKGRKNLSILSAPARTLPNSVNGKYIWCKKNLGNVRVILRQADEKQQFAAPNSILIDDYERNISQWKAKGGIPILHKNAADTISQLKKLGL